jgi:hypothetical protein
MTALSVIEHLNVLKDVLSRVFTGSVVPMVHEIARVCPEEAFDTGIVPAVALSAHAGGDAVLAETCHSPGRGPSQAARCASRLHPLCCPNHLLRGVAKAALYCAH